MTLTANKTSFKISGRTLIHAVSVSVNPGEVLGIIGPNGAGKSTLIRLLAGFLKPSEGYIQHAGTSLHALTSRQRARRIAFVAQDTAVSTDLSARDLVLMGRYAYKPRFRQAGASDRVHAHNALAAVGMSHLAHRGVPTLSGGERQLVHIARAIAQDADTIILDEPTSALDIHHRLRVYQLITEQAHQGKAVAAVLHDLNDAARYCDRLAVIHDGRLIDLGTTDEVLTPSLLERVYRIDALVQPGPRGTLEVHPLTAHQ
ncbi:ABC transporter ATP-binding protein [Corynebacterium casei]|uniref:ABC transporter ATP-binding protein n=1 Tax=Corynebacterium casei TaxID=160386 RepID=UPI003FD1B99E